MAANTSPSTIAEAESLIEASIERLRTAPLSPDVMTALSYFAPEGFRTIVQFEDDGRMMRGSASIGGWSPDTGGIFFSFERIAPKEWASTQSKANASAQTRLGSDVLLAPVQESHTGPVSTLSSSGSAPSQEVLECCSALAEAEKQGRPFYAIKWFRDTFLPEKNLSWTESVQDRQRVLNQAIQEGYIETRSIPNPNNASFPTTTLQLNRAKASGLLGSRFRPVRSQGESAAKIIDDERGVR